jgi:P27 family predicted phage terminase small subunit
MKKSVHNADRTIPAHLSPEARSLWARMSGEFVLDDAAAVALLRVACEAFDRAESARQLLQSEGMAIRDRFGQSKPNPMLAVERDARAQLISAIRALRLAPEVL